jgi:hypothetical protein
MGAQTNVRPLARQSRRRGGPYVAQSGIGQPEIREGGRSERRPEVRFRRASYASNSRIARVSRSSAPASTNAYSTSYPRDGYSSLVGMYHGPLSP